MPVFESSIARRDEDAAHHPPAAGRDTLSLLSAEHGAFKFFLRKASPAEIAWRDDDGKVHREMSPRTMFFGLMTQGFADQPSEQIWDCTVKLRPTSSEYAALPGFDIGAGPVTDSARIFIRQTSKGPLILGVSTRDICAANGEEVWYGDATFEPVRKYNVGETLMGYRADQVLTSEIFASPEQHLPLTAGKQIEPAPDDVD